MATDSSSSSSGSSVVVVVPLPAQGHTPALIHLSRKLAAEGFSIVIVNVESVHRKIAARWKCSPQLDIRLESIPFTSSIPTRLDAQALSQRQELQKALFELRVPLEELLVSRLIGEQGLEIKCIISDFHAVWTTPVAQKLGVPQVCFWSGSAAWALIDRHVPLLVDLEYIPVPEASSSPCVDDDSTTQGCSLRGEKMISFIPGMDPFPALDLPYYLQEFSKVPVWSLVAKSQRFNNDKWFIANTFEALEPRETQAMKQLLGEQNFLAIGPLLPLDQEGLEQVVSLEEEELGCLEWLDSRPEGSVLYISFGSLAVLTQEQFMELALGVESSGISFLWVIRPAFLPQGDLPTMEFFQGFRDRMVAEKRSIIVPWTPQKRVLSHASIGAFLTHCGWNSIVESVWSGVPMLGWPCHSDQNLNLRLPVESKGIGARVACSSRRMEVVHRERVRAVVRKAIEDGGEMRGAVRELRDLAVAAVVEGGSSNRDMATFVERLRSL
ncbi:anthocyanidin 3-O-glucosyltransferase 2 [Selaginella moellendorffii]|uniref:anthocyanidin 3-O-glucosyltransferase 2 n=1 Tax=Selaginella moellendorffii TaxID=88036 RepID=UPI000D1CADF8|nr:anthocyanidin 3-O-glucosyltransferase 2 [Selaginella moellendorffii]|eukprot:XP_024514981.1 anthocyanidin 3-O-glucosyltransferase 2 [Selaginella moellendorffii]